MLYTNKFYGKLEIHKVSIIGCFEIILVMIRFFFRCKNQYLSGFIFFTQKWFDFCIDQLRKINENVYTTGTLF